MRTASHPQDPRSAATQYNGATERSLNVFEIEEEDLQEAIKEIGAAVEEDRRGRLKSYFQIGRLVKKHYRRQQAKYEGPRENFRHWQDCGNLLLEQLAEALELPVGWLQKRFQLVLEYDEEAFEELCQTPGMTATKAIRLADVVNERFCAEL